MLASKRLLVGIVLPMVALIPLATGEAQAQSPPRQSRLAMLRQQNALQQQRNAVQYAQQQTTAIYQTASLQGASPNAFSLAQQQSALQIALQQTTALLQASYRQNTALSHSALGELNTLQTVLQQTISLQNSLPMQSGQLTSTQLQALSQEQASLAGLLATPASPIPARSSGK
jgi:hypothetical protein